MKNTPAGGYDSDDRYWSDHGDLSDGVCEVDTSVCACADHAKPTGTSEDVSVGGVWTRGWKRALKEMQSTR